MEDETVEFTPHGIGIPSEVLYNPMLTQLEKFLFGFIQNLCKTERGCWATNAFLGRLLLVKPQSITNAIGTLKKYRYIRVEFVKKDYNNLTERRIYENTEYKTLYLPLVQAFYTNYKKCDNDTILRILYDTINTIIPPYYEDYRKEGSSYSSSYSSSLSLPKGKDSETQVSRPPLRKIYTKKMVIPQKDYSTLLPSKKPKAKNSKEEYYPPNHFMPILELWKSKGLYLSHNAPKTIERAVATYKKLISGAYPFTKHYTKEQVMQSITNFALAATDINYEPKSKWEKENILQKQNLASFFYNQFGKRCKSYFIEYLNPPKSTIIPIEENDPMVTNFLKKFFIDEVCGGIGNVTPYDMNKFRKAANMCSEFRKRYKSKFSIGFINLRSNDLEIARILCDTLKTNTNGNLASITPGYFCSDKIWGQWVPKYMNDNAMLGSGGYAYTGYKYEEDKEDDNKYEEDDE